MPNDPELLHDYARIGVDRVLVPVTTVTGLDSGINNPDDVLKWRETIEQFEDVG